KKNPDFAALNPGYAFTASKKVAARPWGRPGRARTRSGDGEGWGRDRGRGAPCLVSVRRGCRGGRVGVAEPDPHVGIRLRLALHEAIARLVPAHDVLGLIVENEVALVG